ncbi:unnamed protein product [Cylicocyclus nassatus]|uniref:Uncharacterized protein n=1 Tax=Cylicocyclus nassatus TaxID=53992 RepID=A0AA36GY37_CYLNA|nr:unnamed protein product [Cylicocyclus nassatus]
MNILKWLLICIVFAGYATSAPTMYPTSLDPWDEQRPWKVTHRPWGNPFTVH